MNESNLNISPKTNEDMLSESLLPSQHTKSDTQNVDASIALNVDDDGVDLITTECEVLLPNEEGIKSCANVLSSSGEATPTIASATATIISPDNVTSTLNSNTTQTIMMQVVAPATLEEGYTFDATLSNGMTFSVTVPKGGVREGESFQAPYHNQSENDDLAPPPSAPLLNNNENPHKIPSSRWRDGIFDCCSQGCCHPSIKWAFTFKAIGISQVMTRLNLNLCGFPVRNGKTNVFYYAIGITISLYVLLMTLSSLLVQNKEDLIHEKDQDEDDAAYMHLLHERNTLLTASRVIGTSFVIFTLFLIARTRYHLRQLYNIPPSCCSCCSASSSCVSRNVGFGCDDMCYAYFCGPCVVSQMSRHTADYDTYRANCCSKDGLGSGVPPPVIV
mmetsp:Transcript_11673/g.16545  ORF Transcript_11673/g.16545 Transcript_11673/m.16545 type:complete len:389 (+) Transcript_11673:77-1243(+)